MPSPLQQVPEIVYRLGSPLLVKSDKFGGTLRIGRNALKCVVFFGVPDPDKGISYGGTGFLVHVTESGIRIPFLLTNRHVARALEARADTGFFVRANTVDGGSKPIPFEEIDWFYPDDKSVDLAAAIFVLDSSEFDAMYYDLEGAYPQLDNNYKVARGDPINLVGLFRLHHGRERNIPIVHSGHIAALPNPEEKIPMKDRTTGQIIETEAYLIEAQTLEGLSGSPVFLREITTLKGFELPEGGSPFAFGSSRLMGLYQGSWDGDPGEILADDRNFRGGVRVPVGMGSVIPSEKILDFFANNETAKQWRKSVADRKRVETAQTQDSDFPVPSTGSDNPSHREDFNRLLGAAVPKHESSDET